MAYSYVRYTGNGSTTNYVFPFSYINASHVKVRLNGVLNTNFSFLNASTIQLTTAPASGAVIEIRRETPKDSPIVNFTDGSVLLERDLDLLAAFDIYIAQETQDSLDESIRKDSLGVWNGSNSRLGNLADPVNAQDAATKAWSESTGSSFVGAAASSASAAATSASNAATSATAAAGSSSSAASSATTATSQAATATTQATASATSATAAAGSATAASGSATAAASSASAAATSATNANTSRVAAQSAQTAAEAARDAAAASYDSFDDRYLGVKSADPSVDNDGNALVTGALYFSSVSNTMRVYNGSSWQDVAQGVSFPYQIFNGNGSATGFTLSGTPGSLGNLEVFISGVRQRPTTDYTWSGGTTLTFTSAPPTGTSNIFVRWVTTQAINVPADGSVTTVKVADAAVTTAKVADTSITAAKLSSDLQGATYGMKNRIINGAMMIDQRNAGASVTPSNGQYITDRFAAQLTQSSKYSAQQSTDAPSGFVNSLKITSLSAFSVGASDYFGVYQPIEGLNCFDLSWGSASAKTVTLSFWVKSSLTGTFGGSIYNSAANRSYSYTYTISSANTWEQKSVTVTGDTTGTWLTTNGVGIYVVFGLGSGATVSGTAGSWAGATYTSATGATSVVGTNGATFYITGVQLEKGSTATSFDYRPYGTELALCQRYYQQYGGVLNAWQLTTYGSAGSQPASPLLFPVAMRAAPTSTLVGAPNYSNSSAVALSSASPNSGFMYHTVTALGMGVSYCSGSSNYFKLDAEL